MKIEFMVSICNLLSCLYIVFFLCKPNAPLIYKALGEELSTKVDFLEGGI